MLLLAFVIAAIVTLQATLVPAPALANSIWDETWYDNTTIRIENDGSVSVVGLRARYRSSDDRPLNIDWALVDAGANLEPGTYAEVEVGEVGANEELLPYNQVEDVESLEVGDYAIVEDEQGTRVVMRLKNPNDQKTTYRVSYRLTGAVRRWSDVGEARLRLWNPKQEHCTDNSFEVLFPNDKDGHPTDTPTDLHAWDHHVTGWDDEDEVSSIAVEASNGGYGARNSVYLVDDVEHEVCALFPAALLYEMNPLPQSHGKAIRAQEDAAAEARNKKLEEEREQWELKTEAERSAREQRLRVEEPLYLVISIGMGAYCIYKARRIRRAYEKSHLGHVATSWSWLMFAKYRPERRSKKDEPKDEGVGDAMLLDDVHPLVMGWALTGDRLVYSAITATLARLSTLGVVEIRPAYVAKSTWDDMASLLGRSYEDVAQGDRMLVFHKERFGLVSDPLDKEVLDMFEGFVNAVSDSKSVTSRRSFVGADQGDCFLLSDMICMITGDNGQYLKSLRRLRAAVRKTCHEQGLDDDQTTLGQRRLIMTLIVVYACVLVGSTAVVFADGSVTIIASIFITFIVFPYLFSSRAALTPLSQKAVQLRSELGRLRLWLRDSDDKASEEFDAQAWQLILARAMVVGEDGKAADRMWQSASALTRNAGIRSMIEWCGMPAWGVIWAFEDATRRATRVRGVTPPPYPSY